MEEDGGGTGVFGEVVVDFGEVAFVVAVGPEEEFEGAFGGVGFFGFEFLDIGAGEAASAGAVVDLDGDFEANDVAG